MHMYVTVFLLLSIVIVIFIVTYYFYLTFVYHKIEMLGKWTNVKTWHRLSASFYLSHGSQFPFCKQYVGPEMARTRLFATIKIISWHWCGDADSYLSTRKCAVRPREMSQPIVIACELTMMQASDSVWDISPCWRRCGCVNEQITLPC